ncbi:MAG: hypothetical protein ACYCO0_03480 [Candidatus Micrarchaeaceae archaeon]
MVEVTKVEILTELNKRLEKPNSVFSADTLRDKLGISKELKTDEWQFFYKELTLCIQEGLIKFYNDFDEKDFKESFQGHNDVNFYMNHVQNKTILITSMGQAWLNQNNMNKEIQSVKKAVEANNSSIIQLDKRSWIIGITIITLTIIGILIAFFHL